MNIKTKTYFNKEMFLELSDDDLVIKYDSKHDDEYVIGIFSNDFCLGENTKYHLIHIFDELFRDELYDNIVYNSQRILEANFIDNNNIVSYEYDTKFGYDYIGLRELTPNIMRDYHA